MSTILPCIFRNSETLVEEGVCKDEDTGKEPLTLIGQGVFLRFEITNIASRPNVCRDIYLVFFDH